LEFWAKIGNLLSKINIRILFDIGGLFTMNPMCYGIPCISQIEALIILIVLSHLCVKFLGFGILGLPAKKCKIINRMKAIIDRPGPRRLG
jgi:hypothetical protein